MNQPTVLLLFGGESSEHEVSITSARNVYAALDDTKYTVLLGYIDRSGKWWLLENLSNPLSIHASPQLLPVLGTKSFITLPHDKIVKPDVILPILHGKNGEDGAVQGLAQMLHIPTVGSDMTTSVLCMHKLATKEILASHDIAVVPYEVHREGYEVPDFNKLSMRLGSPVFVKPSRAGSSVGVHKVFSEDDFTSALQEAHQHDDVVLIEASVAAQEIEVAIRGNPPHHTASAPGEVKPHADFYSYDVKYSANSEAELVIPADLSEAESERVRSLALRVYEILGCHGLARVDFFLQNDDTLYVNEVNTLPGFTNASMYPKLWRHSGVTYPQLVDSFISSALEGKIKANETEE